MVFFSIMSPIKNIMIMTSLYQPERLYLSCSYMHDKQYTLR